MDEKNVNISFDFLGMLTLILITLRLCGVIKWHWIWVLAPMWIPIGILILVMGVYLIVKTVRSKKNE